MPADFWEQAVETFLTIDRGLFLNPQYLVGKPGEWEGCPDFLAICFPEKVIWMVEVSKSPRAGLKNKIDEFNKEYVPRIKAQLIDHGVVESAEKWEIWQVGLWIFAPQSALSNLQVRMQDAGIKTIQVTALEVTITPDWTSHFR